MVDADDNIDKASSGSICRISGDVKVIVDSKMIKVLTETSFGNVEDIVIVCEPEE